MKVVESSYLNERIVKNCKVDTSEQKLYGKIAKSNIMECSEY